MNDSYCFPVHVYAWNSRVPSGNLVFSGFKGANMESGKDFHKVGGTSQAC